MAEEFDYLRDSKFGNLATNILDKREKDNDRLIPKGGNLLALFADVAAKYITKKNRDLQQEQATNIETLTRQYNDVIGTRKDFFNSDAIKKQRENYQLWKNPETKQKARLAKAIEYFNQDKDMIEEFGSMTPYNEYLKLPKNSKNSELMNEALELLMGQADIYFESITDDAIVVPTQAEYLREVKQAFEAALKEARNDPTKKSFLRKQFLKAFGRDEKGNPRFGLVNQDELKNLRVNAEEAAGIGRDNPLAMVSDLDIEQREADKARVFERPDLGEFDFLTQKPKSSKPNPTDRRVLLDAANEVRSLFNDQYKFNIKNNKGNDKTVSFHSVYKNIDRYNGSSQMQGQYNKTNIIYDILTLSKTARAEFEKTNFRGDVRSAESFLVPAIQEVFDRMSNGLPSLGFENTMEVIASDEMVEFTSNGTDYKMSIQEVTETFIGKSNEDKNEWIDNIEFEPQYKFIFDVLRRRDYE